MQNKLVKALKATISSIIVALLITGLLIVLINLFFGQEIGEIFSLVNKVSITIDDSKEQKPTIINEENNVLENYPEYGTKYGTIEIPSIDVNQPIYFGDTLDILKKGVGHSSGSYFPGEGGSIIYMVHNYKKEFRRFSELKKVDEYFGREFNHF